jgi:regulator of ribonuclease activity A
MSMTPTADLCDQHGDRVAVAAPIFRSFGGRARFAGAVATLECFEDNSLVRAMLEEPGAGRVLVVDGGGSLRCALVGGNLAVLAQRSGWAGIVVHGCVRDSAELARVDIGILALATHPRRSEKRGIGRRDVAIAFADVAFRPGGWICADEDGLVVAAGEP